MFTIEIESRPSVGYSTPVYSWPCPLCITHYDPNLEQEFIETLALVHMMERHNTDGNHLRIVVKEMSNA